MRVLLVALLLCTSALAAKSVRVRGGFTKSGTYRAPHVRTAPNGSRADNWSARGNVNPYTGSRGAR